MEDIKIALDALGQTISERSIHLILRAEGFAGLPKRSHQEKKAMGASMILAPKSRRLSFLEAESFKVGLWWGVMLSAVGEALWFGYHHRTKSLSEDQDYLWGFLHSVFSRFEVDQHQVL